MDKWLEPLKKNDYISIKQYLKNGADVGAVNDTGECVLLCALRARCDFDLLMLLVDNGADIFDFDDEGVGVLDMAITYDNIEMVKYILSKGIDINHTNRKSKLTPLMVATCYGRIDILKLLLEHGARKDMVDNKGLSAKDFARKMNKKSILKILEGV